MMDEIEVEAQLMRNKIADIIEEVYRTEVRSLVHDELQQRCEGYKMDDPSQLHYDCVTMDEEEIWVRFYETFKERFNIKLFWLRAQKCASEKRNLQLNNTRMDYLSHPLMMDETSISFIYKNIVRRMEEEDDDEWLKLGCYDDM